MTLRRRRLDELGTPGVLAWALGAVVVLAACQNHTPVGPLHDGVAACQQIADECKGPSELGEPYRDCYDTAVVGDGNACLEIYDRCLAACANPSSGGGAGGEGAADAEGGASGARTAGAGGQGGA